MAALNSICPVESLRPHLFTAFGVILLRVAMRARNVKSRSTHWSQGSQHLRSECGEGPGSAGIYRGHVSCRCLDVSLLPSCTAPPRKYIRGKMAQKQEGKRPWPTASGPNCPCKAYKVWEHPKSIGLGAISNSYMSWESKIWSVQQKM